MHFIVDIDGVLAEQVTPMLEILNPQLGLNLTKEDITVYDQKVGDIDIGEWLRRKMTDPDWIVELPLIPFAAEGVAVLRNIGKVMIATSRPKLGCWATEEWLTRNQIFVDGLMFTPNKELLPGDVLIDDSPQNIIMFGRTEGFGLLFDQPWNRNFDFADPEIKRVYGWKNIIDLLNYRSCTSWNDVAMMSRRHVCPAGRIY
jgi:5'(3')-deoxyribonucleotidase